jgi:hypothetical protein
MTVTNNYDEDSSESTNDDNDGGNEDFDHNGHTLCTAMSSFIYAAICLASYRSHSVFSIIANICSAVLYA